MWRLFWIFFLFSNTTIFSQVFDSSNLPIVIINTNGKTISDNPRIIVDMKIIDNPVSDTNYVSDTLHYNYNAKASIEIRGSSSQMFPKKAYSFETKNDDTATINVPLLGMPSDNDWVLYASYNDKTLIRNFLCMQLSNEMGMYAPRSRYCELVLNGSYQGVYLLMEKIKQGKKRVNIEKLDSTDISGDSLTGGYIVKIDKTSGDNTEGWYSKYFKNNGSNFFYQYHYPEYSDMKPEQRAYIRNFIDYFESTMAGKNYNDTLTGYFSIIDTTSFIIHILISELSRNLDAYRLSTYLNKHKDSKGGKLCAGPIWDYDLAYGMPNYCNAWEYAGWEIETTHDCGWQNPFWWTKLFRDATFHNMLVRHWQKYRQDILSYEHIEHIIDSICLLLRDPQKRNFQRWPILGTYVWPNYYIGATYEQEISYMKNWINLRLTWIDNNLKLLPEIPQKPPVDTTPTPNNYFSLHDNIIIYPNPFSNCLMIDLKEHCTVEISDLTGRILHRFFSTGEPLSWDGKNSQREDTPSGMYIIRIISEEKIISVKVIKK